MPHCSPFPRRCNGLMLTGPSSKRHEGVRLSSGLPRDVMWALQNY